MWVARAMVMNCWERGGKGRGWGHKEGENGSVLIFLGTNNKKGKEQR